MSSLSATYRLLQLRRDMREEESPQTSVQANDLNEFSQSHVQRNDYLQNWVKSVSTNGSNLQELTSPRLAQTSTKGGEKTLSPMCLEPNCDTIRKQARSMLITLCRTMIDYNSEICIEGTVGITVDRKTVVLLHFDDVIEKVSKVHVSPVSNNDLSRNESVDNRNGQDGSETTQIEEPFSGNFDTISLTAHTSLSAASNNLKSIPSDNNREMFVADGRIKFEPTEEGGEEGGDLVSTNDNRSRVNVAEYEDEFDVTSAREGESEVAYEDEDWTPEGHEGEIPLDNEDWAPNVQHRRKAPTTKFKRHLEFKKGNTTKMTLLRELLLQRTPILNTNQCNSDELGRNLTSGSAVAKHRHLEQTSRLVKKRKMRDAQEMQDSSACVTSPPPSRKRTVQTSQKRMSDVASTSRSDSTPILGSLLALDDSSSNTIYNLNPMSSSVPHGSLGSRNSSEERGTSRNDPIFKCAGRYENSPVGRLGQMTLMDLLPRSYNSPSYSSKLKSLTTTATEVSNDPPPPPSVEPVNNDANFMYTRLLHKLVDSRKQDESRMFGGSHANDRDAFATDTLLSHRDEENGRDVYASNPPNEYRGGRKSNKSNSRMRSLLESGPLRDARVDGDLNKSFNGLSYPPYDDKQCDASNYFPVDQDIVTIKTEASSNDY